MKYIEFFIYDDKNIVSTSKKTKYIKKVWTLLKGYFVQETGEERRLYVL